MNAKPVRRTDGLYHQMVTVGYKADGSLDRRRRSAKTLTELRRKVDQLKADVARGDLLDPGRPPTFAQWCDSWLASVKLSVKPNTWAGYEGAARVHLKPGLGGQRLDRIRPEHIEQLYAGMLDAGQSTGNIQAVRRVLNICLKSAVQRGLLARNPAALAKAPRHESPEVEPLTVAESRQIMAAASRVPNGAAFTVALSLGLRRGEVLGLRWSDVDLGAGRLIVRASLSRRKWQHGCGERPCGYKRGAECPQRHDGGLLLDTPKSRAGRRHMVLPAPLVQLLAQHLRSQHEARTEAGGLWEDRDFVFCDAVGSPLDPDRHTKAWNALLANCGVREARLHDARHTAATVLLVQGVDQRTVMALLGWSQVSMAARYQHVVDELRAEAALRVSAAFWGAETVGETASPALQT